MNTKSWKTPARVLAAALLAGGALMSASSAFAQYAPHNGEPHMVQVDTRVSIGWHENRYWDGHRYWERDEWMRHHPHDPGPPGWHGDRHDTRYDDHRPPPPPPPRY
ncbi:hypothetical protein LMG28688_04334 [Paraburkholderia caffeinitolerans]|uniref:Lipoprotein n=1 Tax=Paraburkholderia caffeinitolerans TaxID=1723730 RepID=A0A6J5GD21_9BURK|nr:hypothetical protein [Paraburkholderia caffeinitolerans]CAB3796539.1 hypothetical protein LMG28688_04334 [Paraburkholderia caffeinitolerans]